MIGAPGLVLNDDDTIINWGDSQCTHLFPLNKSSAIRLVANKLTAFDAFSSANVPIPAYAKAKADVGWEGLTVVRHKLTGHSGEGIELCDAQNSRTHRSTSSTFRKNRSIVSMSALLSNGSDAGTMSLKIIAVQRKARRHDVPTVKSTGKSATTPTGSSSPGKAELHRTECLDAARAALDASGLDFGAVDVILTKQGKAYVLEINTAPGLEGTTVTDYANFFRGD
jgi:predicted ATP-grasp superfamily ATP-dependent carboligase